jgi:uncharacterized protein (TIGR02453 family)
MLQSSTIKFLKGLAKNNNKPWFDKHRTAYDAARSDFASFIQKVIDQHAKNDATIKPLVAKDCMFRINRDIRFSKDKTPYKKNFAASINKGGRKSMLAGYYFHLEPGQTFVGGGVYQPMPEELKKLRQEIDYNLADFKKIIGGKKFKSVYGDIDRSAEFLLTRVPKGYDPGNPAADLLRLKSYIAMVELKDSDLTSKDLVKKTLASFAAIQPLLFFLNNAIEG